MNDPCFATPPFPRRTPALLRWLRAALPALLAVWATAAMAADAPAPVFNLPARDGTIVDLAKLRGQVVMINFWASWCGPCRQEMPLLEKIYEQYHKFGFTLLGVNVEPDSAAAAGFLKQTPVTFPILFDTKSLVSNLYNVSGMPSSAFIDRQGNLRLLHEGYKPGDENLYLDQIRALVRE
ncbi:MAG TPA: TlpA disulfide reductase family protein [Steroidobacteraceae bacterium]|nr:TlpA disulfide reductase family protein [Steroidobacteraceae bacterium]